MAVKKNDIIFVGLQFLLFAAYFFEVQDWKLNLPADTRIVHLVLAGVGFSLCLVAMLELNQNLSPFPTPRKKGKLVTGGLFQYVRHPIYTGILMAAFFLALYFHSGYKIVIFLLLLLLFYFKSNYEEEQLIQKYPEYKGYRAETGRFFPKI